MRWKHGVVGLMLAAAAMVGCKQQCFLHECDYNHYNTLGLPANLDTNPNAAIMPITRDVPPPTTVLDPERGEVRFLTLAEAIAIALERGEVGGQQLSQLGFASDNLTQGSPISLGGFAAAAGNDNIRVLALDPADTATSIESAESRFDARWITALNWNKIDDPLGGNVLQNFRNGDQVEFATGLRKDLPTGGTVGMRFGSLGGQDFYTMLSSPPTSVVNPAYRPRLTFGFEQPLLRGFGVEINQIRDSHPGAIGGNPGILNSLTGVGANERRGGTEGILITRIRFDSARAEFERNVNLMLLNVETAYWNLYGAYWSLYAQEQVLRQAYEAWKINRARYEAGRIAIQDFAQTRLQYEQFRGQRLSALGEVLERERQLRGLLGLPIEDGCRLVPVDQPTLAPYRPDWCMALNEALSLRPELIEARDDLKIRQLNIINQKNLLLPELRLSANYQLNGLGTRLDGAGSDTNDLNALRVLASQKFSSWGIGLQFEVPLGFRNANAALRSARLDLARTFLALQDLELKAQRFLAQQYRHIVEFHEQIQIQRARREAAAQQLEARFKEFLAGKGTLDILLEAKRNWGDALTLEYNAIRDYNNALVAFEFAKGTILQHDNVHIGEGPLPQCAQVRAVEHEKERSKALVLLKRQNPVVTPCCSPDKGCCGLPQLPAFDAPSIPSIMEGQKGLPEVPDHLPDPKAEPLPAPKSEDARKTKPAAPASGKPTAALPTPSPLDALRDPSPELPAVRGGGASPYLPALPKSGSPTSPPDRR